MRKQTGLLFTLLIVLGGLVLTAGNVYAGDSGVQSGRLSACGEFSDVGLLNPPKGWCDWQFGPYEKTCNKPEKCNDGLPPRSLSGGPGGLAGYFNSPRGKNSPPSALLDKKIGGQQETTWRRISSHGISLLMLFGALGGIAFSLRKLLRPRPASPRRRIAWTVPYPRAIGYAVIAVLSLTATLWLTQSPWISSGRVRAAPHQRAKRKQPLSLRGLPLAPRNLDSASSGPFAVGELQFSSAFQVGGKGVLQIGGTAVDKQGNTYVAGAFYGTVTFNTGEHPTTLTSTEDFDVFVAKYDPENHPLWARVANGATGLTQTDPKTGAEEHYSLDGALSVAVDAQGNAYVGGGFVKSLSFKDAAGNTVATLSDSNSDINFEIFVAKYDAAGALLWARGGGSGAPPDTEADEDLDAGINGITDIVVDKVGNPYVTGTVSGVNFLGRAITNNGQRDILLSRLDPATGNPVWVSTPGSPGIDAAMGLAIDDHANLYLIGDVGASITFPTQPQPTTLTVDEDFGDSFLAKYDQNGQALWAKQMGGDQPIEGVHVVATGAGDVYLAGAFVSEATFDSITVADPSEYLVVSGFLAKYSTGGNAQWVRIFGHYNNDGTDGFTFGYRVALDNAGTPYVLGTFDNEVTFNVESSDARQSLTSEGREDNFIAHYDAAGNYRWVKQLKESEDPAFSISDESVPVETVPLRILHNEANDSLLVTADFLGTVALDNLTLNSGPDIHSYVATLPLAQSILSVQFGASSYSARENDGNVAVSVTRDGDTSGAATVDYATSDAAGLTGCSQTNTGIASSRCDYASTVGTLRFAAGETSRTILIPVVDDSYAEGPETFTLSLSNPQGATLGSNSTATLTIVDNDATAGANPITQTAFFVRQQYIDFLGREPDPTGYRGWQEILNRCAAGDTSCDRISVSSGFFRSPEFQARGYFIFRFYATSLGRNPTYAEFIPDLAKVSGFLTPEQLEANQAAFVQEFTARAEYVNRYSSLGTTAFVDTLLQTAGVANHPQRVSWINSLNDGSLTRAQVLRALVESTEVYNKFYNQAFVVMQYFGYLRRDPDVLYLQWLQMLNQTGNYRMMISGFINSNEYVQRFGP